MSSIDCNSSSRTVVDQSSPVPLLIKIVSGGQTGADQGGLEAGVALGLVTGGFAPRGYLTERGPQPDLLGGFFALHETASGSYPERTRANVRLADGTVVFAPGAGVKSPGTRLTLRACREEGRPVLVNPASPAVLRSWVETNRIRVLNVAGNRESRCPGLQRRVAAFIEAAFSPVVEEDDPSF